VCFGGTTRFRIQPCKGSGMRGSPAEKRRQREVLLATVMKGKGDDKKGIKQAPSVAPRAQNKPEKVQRITSPRE